MFSDKNMYAKNQFVVVTRRHFSRVFRHGHLPDWARIAMRWPGATLLLGALMILVRAEGPPFGVLAWACLASISAMFVALMLAWLPKAMSST